MYWHDSRILAPNAAVLIAVFALRLSAGGLSVMFARSDGQKGRREKGTSNSCQDGIFKGLYRCASDLKLFNEMLVQKCCMIYL